MAAASTVTAVGASPFSTDLARNGRALHRVIVAADASDATKSTAAELADYLGRISGATFEVETGDGSRGIVVGRAASFPDLSLSVEFGSGPFQREDYVLRSHAEGLYLLGATDTAVSHAAWDLLYRLGHRQFFPGETWEVVPSNARLSIAVDCRESPSFRARRIWYNWGLRDYNQGPYRQWCRRNRAVKGFDLNSGHSYGSIIAANRKAFDEHPEYFALIDGKREYRGGDTKFCISNTGLRKLVVEHAVRTFRNHPQADSVSMDPSDGGGWCQCDSCAAMGSVSNRVVTLANEVAQACNALGLGTKYVGIYAYNEHSAPPTVRVDPHVIPSATTAFIRGGYTFDQIIEGWQAQGATMGVYDYLSVVAWDWNLPRGGNGSRPSRSARFLPDIHKKGVRFYDAESGDCWGPCGLGYYVTSRILWDIEEAQQLDALIEDFLEKAFGSAKEPMRAFYHLITEDTSRRPPADLVGRMYRCLDEARRASDDAKVLARIDDLILYTRYVELYHSYANRTGSVDDVARHANRMRKTMMVHTYGLWCRLINQKAALDPSHPLKSDEPFSPQDISQILAEGMASNVPVDPGFDSVEFTKTLVPAAGRLNLPATPLGSFPTHPQDRQRYFTWMPEGGGTLDLQITVQKQWVNRLPEIRLHSPLEVTGKAVATDASYRPDGKPYRVRLRTPHSGLHTVATVDGGDYTRIQWPTEMPVTIESGIDTPDVTTHFRGAWTMVFYVPRGTHVIGGWASRIANWAPRISGTLVAPDGSVALDFATAEEGWFNVPVPEGQDGKLWTFKNSQGQRLLMTVPPYLARNGQELLLPREVVEADAKQ
jgi:hypothetical protein